MPKNKTLKEIVGDNVKAIMATKKLSQTKVAAAAKKSGTPIDQTTVGRIARADFPATLDSLEALANGLGVEPWQVLYPKLDPAALPKAVPGLALTEADREQVEQAKRLLSDLSAAQRDLFLQDGLVKDLLLKPHFPVEKMGPGWNAPAERKKR